jgi:hypothetical protein
VGDEGAARDAAELAGLRRRAYGPGDGGLSAAVVARLAELEAAGRAAARPAVDAVDAVDAAATGEHARADAAAGPAPAPAAPAPDEAASALSALLAAVDAEDAAGDPGPPRRQHRPRRRRRRIGGRVALVAVAVVAVGAAFATGYAWGGPRAAPAAAVLPEFATAQTDEDLIPRTDTPIPGPVDTSSSRYIASVAGTGIWIARSVAGGLCVVSRVEAQSAQISCAGGDDIVARAGQFLIAVGPIPSDLIEIGRLSPSVTLVAEP